MRNLDINSLEKLFNDVELYCKLDFNIYTFENDKVVLNEEEFLRLFDVLGAKENRITSFCRDCKMNYPFEVLLKGNQVFFNHRYCVGFNVFKDCSINLEEGLIDFSIPITLKKSDIIKDASFFFEYTFKCTNKPESHIYKMFLIVSKKDDVFSVTKIGQQPSMIDVHGFDFDCYKKQLNAFDAYSDFRKAQLCISDGFSAGAYTYLRRVFEKMLNKYCIGIELEDNHTETKIKACKTSFDPRIHKLLPRLYKILSKGIHELDDSESYTYYEYLNIIINMQLEFVKENDDKDSQTKMLDQKLDDIISKIGD